MREPNDAEFGEPEGCVPSRVSLIATVFNERESILSWLGSVQAQTRAPDEIVIVDGGSEDGTAQVLLKEAEADPRIIVESAPGANISCGRNMAIGRARGPIIAVADAGTRMLPDWLERIVAPLEADPDLAVSSGFFRPDGRSRFERILAAVITPRLGEFDPDSFLPSSRSVAFQRRWWRRVGGYPEWLRASEDLVFDIALREAGARFAFEPGAIVRWYPNTTLAAFFRQYRSYSRGDGHAGLWPVRHTIRYSAYAGGVTLLAVGFDQPLAWAGLVAGFLIYMSKFWGRVRAEHPATGVLGMLGAYAMAPVIVVCGDLGKMIGYPQGRIDRLRRGRGPAAIGFGASPTA